MIKLRAASYRGGYHDMVISTGGLTVYPRLVAAEHRREASWETVSSGIAEIDDMFGGGLDRGTSTLLIGPAGAGKSTLAAQYVVAGAQRGEPAAIYIFNESRETFLRRADGLGMDLRTYVNQGLVTLEQLDPAQLSPGAFVHLVRSAVEDAGARTVIIDSLNGYINAMAEERLVLIQLHELLTYLGQEGVLTLLTLAQHGLVGAHESPIDATYLADTVVLLRYFEAAGTVRQAISVVKKRTGAHDRTVREMKLGPGIQVGAPLTEFEGVLSGTPRFSGSERSLIPHDDD